MKHLTTILTLLLAACQPQPVVTAVPHMSQQEIDFQARADAAWDAAEESRKRVAAQYEQEQKDRWGNK